MLGADTAAWAEMAPRTGVVPIGAIPAPLVSEAVVRLDVPHSQQGLNLCVPTSSAMILRYFGKTYDPSVLKARAETHKPPANRNRDFTLWRDMKVALLTINAYWEIRNYPRTDAGLAEGLADIKTAPRSGNPVMIDVHLAQGHTFVIMGYNDHINAVYVRDPDLPASHVRILPYTELASSWHNHRFGPNRSAFFPNAEPRAARGGRAFVYRAGGRPKGPLRSA